MTSTTVTISFYPEHRLGNIHQQDLNTLNNSDQAVTFGLAKRDTLTPDCRRCEYRPVCHGGCPKHRFAVSPSGHPGHNYLCAGYKHFFKHITRDMNLISELMAAGYPAQTIMSRPQQNNSHEQFARNAPCPCSSGKKYKKCCAG